MRRAIGMTAAALVMLATTEASAGSVCRVIGASAANAEVTIEFADAGLSLAARCDRERTCRLVATVDGKEVYDRETTLHEICYGKSKWLYNFDGYPRKCRGEYDYINMTSTEAQAVLMI